MSVLKTVGIVGLGTAVTGGGGYLIYDNFIDIGVKTLKTKDYEEGSFGRKYGMYLLDPANKKNAEEWNKAFERWDKNQQQTSPSPSLSTEFAKNKFTKGYAKTGEEGEDKALNKTCGDFFKEENYDSWAANKKTNVWTYCSILKSEPKLVPTTGHSYTGKFGGESTFSGKLVAVKEGNKNVNEDFWRRRNQEFFGEVESDFSGAKASKGSIFETLYNDRHAPRREKEIKNICEESYEKLVNNGNANVKFTNTDIKQFCYLIPERGSDN
ncbi:hypothetical protein [Candidatus Mycoplasma haematohominis]|uniref:hypothetical protein n=1 Tax=Candidatus Mycoplasma haematohominis TaxID=1494318 RepID=UPI001C0A700E|nr:hypothetical protein [Candidatus Mycoplasma haemohominis]